MARPPQRIIEAAKIERIGVVTAQQLLAMSDTSWGLIRDQITDRRNGGDGLNANCMACDSPVYIRGPKMRGIPRPQFQHYSGCDPTCPWYAGNNIRPDDARSAQYQGKQESKFHRTMCELVAELAALDSRYVRHSISEYLPPTDSEYGRYPDIYVEWRDFGKFAVEFQMSGTFQTEISGRCSHYGREGMPLLWILFGIESTDNLSQSFVDIIRRHRGNAFVLDPTAVEASRLQKTLVLSCYLRSEDGKLHPPALVRFDKLAIPKSKLPYHQDMIVAPRLAEFAEARQPWFKALDDWQSDRYRPLQALDHNQSILVAAVFSLIAYAAGKPQNYASNHSNLTAMMNTYLSTQVLSRYSDLLSHLISNIALERVLKPSVHDHLVRYRDPIQVTEDMVEWQLLKELVPEVFDPVIRQELHYLDALPSWGAPTSVAFER